MKRTALLEAIQAATHDTFRQAVISVFNAFKTSQAWKAGKIPLLVNAVQRMVSSFTIGTTETKDRETALNNASRLVGVVLFLLQLEDLHQLIDSSISDLTKTRQEYMDMLKQEYPDKEPYEPTIEQFLQNKYRQYRMKITLMLNYKTPQTKDPPTVLFRKHTKDLDKPDYQLVTSDMKDIVAKQLLKLTLAQFTDLSKKIQSAMSNISAVKRVVGQASREELNTKLFNLPPPNHHQQQQQNTPAPDQKPIKPRL